MTATRGLIGERVLNGTCMLQHDRQARTIQSDTLIPYTRILPYRNISPTSLSACHSLLKLLRVRGGALIDGRELDLDHALVRAVGLGDGALLRLRREIHAVGGSFGLANLNALRVGFCLSRASFSCRASQLSHTIAGAAARLRGYFAWL